MAWENLLTNFEDVTWDGLRKYQVVDNGDGTFSFIDVTDYQNTEHSYWGANDVNRTNEAVNELHGSLTNIIASEFNEETAYSVGDYVIYDDSLYKFISSHEAGEWDEDEVQSVMIVDEMSSGGGSSSWGSITGTLSNQTDLKTALDSKADSADLGDDVLNVLKSLYYKSYSIYCLGKATSTTNVRAMIPLVNPEGTIPTVSNLVVDLEGNPGATPNVDTLRTNADTVTINITGSGLTQNRAYILRVDFTLS